MGSLGGIFSKTWKPKKNHEIRGPVLTSGKSKINFDTVKCPDDLLSDSINVYTDDSFIQKGSHIEWRQKLGLSGHLPRSDPPTFPSEPTSALEKVEVMLIVGKKFFSSYL